LKIRLIAAAATSAAALVALTACGSSGSSSSASSSGSAASGSAASGPITLNFYGADYGTSAGAANSTTNYWNAVATAFHAANPNITVKVQTVDWNDFPTKVATLIQNKQYPDILEGNPAPPYAQSSLIYPISQVLSPSTVSNLIPKFAADGAYQGTDYGIPFTTSTRAMYYNKKIFAKVGIPAPPTTWAELQADAAKITKAGYIGYGLPLGSEEAQAELLLWFLGDDGGYLDASGKYAINSAANVTALTFLKNLAAAGDTEPNPGNTDRKDVWSDFAAGKVGIMLGSPSVIPIIQTAGVLKSSDYATAAVPGKTGPIAKTLGVHDDIVVFKTDASHLAADKAFLDFAYQDKWQLQFDNEYDLLPATQSASKAMAAASPTFAAFLGNIVNSVNYPGLSNWTTVENQIKTTVGQAISGNPAAVLGAIQQTATSTAG
jgi:multiple sugar transport system substrate-binding protein